MYIYIFLRSHGKITNIAVIPETAMSLSIYMHEVESDIKYIVLG